MQFLIVWSLVFSLTHGIEKEIVLHLWLKQICPIEAERERLVNLSAVKCSEFSLSWCVFCRRRMTWREPSVCCSRRTGWAADSLSRLLTSCLATLNSTWPLWPISSTSTRRWPNPRIKTSTGDFWRVGVFAHDCCSFPSRFALLAFAKYMCHVMTHENGWHFFQTLTSKNTPDGITERTFRSFFWKLVKRVKGRAWLPHFLRPEQFTPFWWRLRPLVVKNTKKNAVRPYPLYR